MKFRQPKWDGMFWQSKAVIDKHCRPIIIHMKPRMLFGQKEYDFHIGIPEEIQSQGYCKEAIKSAALQFYDRFGILILSEGRILNERVTQAVRRLESFHDPELDIRFNTDNGLRRWEVKPKEKNVQVQKL